MKHRKDSEANRLAVADTAAMQSEETTEVHHRPERSLWQSLAAGVIALVVAMGIGRFAYTPILPVMQERFDLSNATAGALASSNYLGYFLGALLAAFVPSGRPQDVVLRTSLWAVVAATVLVGLTTDFPAWFVLRFVAGLAGAGVLVLGSAVILEELSRRDRLGFSGILYAGPGVGIALSGLVVLALNGMLAREDAAWRAGWLVLGVLAFALVFPCLAWLPGRSTVCQSTGHARDGAAPREGKVVSTGRVTAGAALALALLGLAYFLEGIGYIVTGTFLPVIVEDLPGLGGLGAGAWILVGLAAVPCTVLWARVATRLGAAAALGTAFALQAFGIFLPAMSSTWWAAAGSAVLFGGTFTGITALTLPYARELAGTRGTGLAIGLLTAVYGVGQALGPLVAARLADNAGGFGSALVAASAAVTLGALLMPAVGLAGTINTSHGKECVHDEGY
jgi:MFS family permease